MRLKYEPSSEPPHNFVASCSHEGMYLRTSTYSNTSNTRSNTGNDVMRGSDKRRVQRCHRQGRPRRRPDGTHQNVGKGLIHSQTRPLVYSFANMTTSTLNPKPCTPNSQPQSPNSACDGSCTSTLTLEPKPPRSCTLNPNLNPIKSLYSAPHQIPQFCTPDRPHTQTPLHPKPESRTPERHTQHERARPTTGSSSSLYHSPA